MSAFDLKLGFIGAGNMTHAIVKSLVEAAVIAPKNIFVANRTQRKLDKIVEEFQVNKVENNEELVDACDVVVIAVKPQDLLAAVEPIATSFTPQHIVISLAAGISLAQLKKCLVNHPQIVRVMPNTPISLKKGVIGYCTDNGDARTQLTVEKLFSPSSYIVKVSEGEEFEALTVAASAGIGFVYELMQYWQEWMTEHNFTPEQARKITVQTFLGASLLADQKSEVAIEELQNKVTSKKGVTSAGLDSMRELEVERLLRYSFEKAVLRDRELGKA